MRRSRAYIPAILWAVPLSASFAQAQTAAPRPDLTLVPYASSQDTVRLADGRKIHLVCMGHGSPTVVLATGGDGWSKYWNEVQPKVAEKTRACAWDRAGLGLSSPSPKVPTVDNSTTDLEEAISVGGIAAPYIMVGHSLGAYDSLLMADRQPSKVAGMVLVDPSFPDQVARYERVTPSSPASGSIQSPVLVFLGKCAAALRAGTVRPGGPDPDGCLHGPPPPSEYPPELSAALDQAAAGASAETIATAMDNIAFYASPKLMEQDAKIAIKPNRNYGSMPLLVLSAAEDGSSPALPASLNRDLAIQLAEKQRAHTELAALSTRGVHRIVQGSSHDIPHIKPQAVIDAIDQLVDQVRRTGRGATLDRR